MARIKGGMNAKKKHNRVLKLAKGYRGARSKQYRVAKQSVMRALTESYKGRKQKKRQFRQLWIARINAAARMNGLSYSKFILIFDDATSALDLKTEADLYSELSAKKYDVTRIIIAQRIASVKNADRIVVMDNGRLADVGSHSELIKTSEIYKDIYESQLKGNE